jgi:hypothetical protein
MNKNESILGKWWTYLKGKVFGQNNQPTIFHLQQNSNMQKNARVGVVLAIERGKTTWWTLVSTQWISRMLQTPKTRQWTIVTTLKIIDKHHNMNTCNNTMNIKNVMNNRNMTNNNNMKIIYTMNNCSNTISTKNRMNTTTLRMQWNIRNATKHQKHDEH